MGLDGATCIPGPCRPDGSPPAEASETKSSATGLELGARLGYGVPLGSSTAQQGDDLSNAISGMVPIQIDAGIRATPNFYLGGYFMYGFGITPGTLSCSSCSEHDMRFGADLMVHLQPEESADPWVGIGMGYETLDFAGTGGGSASASGWELLNLQAGLDLKGSPSAAFGPFVSFSVAQYGNLSLDSPGGASQSQSVSNTALHEWLVIGVRGAFDLGT